MASSTPPPHCSLTTAKPYQNHNFHHQQQNLPNHHQQRQGHQHWNSRKLTPRNAAKPPTAPTTTATAAANPSFPSLSSLPPSKSELSADFSGRRSTRFVSKMHFGRPKNAVASRHTSTAEEALHQAIRHSGDDRFIDGILLNFERKLCGTDDYTFLLRELGNRGWGRSIWRRKCLILQSLRDVDCTTDHLFGAATDAARAADATVLVMGLDQSIEAEFRDRDGLLLPGRQQELVSKVSMASKGPTILVLMSGGAIDVSFAKNDPRIAAIVWAGYPGQAGGAAIADVLFGTHNPGGKLPMTWYPQDYLTKLPMTTMDMRSNPSKGYPGRTYRFYNGPTVYPFGYGISYSNFVHTITAAPTVVVVPLYGHHNGLNNTSASTISGKSIRVTHAKCNKLSIGLRVNVKNVGSKDGSHTLLVFSTPPGGHGAPHKQLVAFEKVHVAAGAQQRVHVNIHVCKYLSVVDRSGIRRIPMGQHSLHIGDIRHSISVQAAALGVIKS